MAGAFVSSCQYNALCITNNNKSSKNPRGFLLSFKFVHKYPFAPIDQFLITSHTFFFKLFHIFQILS